jgi:hypothetical protein
MNTWQKFQTNESNNEIDESREKIKFGLVMDKDVDRKL